MFKYMKNMALEKKRYLYVLDGFLLFLLLGVGYAWSIFVGPLEAWFGWSRAQTSLAFTINMICFAIGVILCGILSARYHYNRIGQLAALLLGGGFLATTQVREVWQLYITYSTLGGIGVGMLYSTVISTVPVWFREKTGVVTGILAMAYALSTTILGPVCQGLLSTQGWQRTFFLLGILDVAVLGVGAHFLRMPNGKELAKLPEPPKKAAVEGRNSTTKEMLRSPVFYFAFVYIVAIGSCGLSVINHLSPLLTGEIGMTAAAAAMAVSVGSLCNGFGRLLSGILFDKKGSVVTARTLAVFNLLVLAVMYGAYRAKSPWLMVVCACGMMAAFGGNSSVIPSIARGLFGQEHFAGNYSVFAMNSLLSGIPASIAGSLQAASGNYKQMFYLMAAGAVIALFGAIGMGKDGSSS